MDSGNPQDAPPSEASTGAKGSGKPSGSTPVSGNRKKGMGKRLLARFGEDLFVAAQGRFMSMSPDQVEKTGARLGMIHYLVDSKHRKRTASNLRMVFPEWGEDQINRSVKEVFRHFGMVAGDFMRSPVRTNEEVLRSVVELEGLEHLQWAGEQGRGTIIVTGHFGNWERFLQWLTASGVKLSVIARDPNQESLQQRIIDIREKAGAKVLSRGNSARQALMCLRKNEVVGLLADQNSPDAMVPFFGIPAGTALGPAVMHLRTGAPLIPFYCVRIGPSRYRAHFLDPVNPDGTIEDRLQIMQQLNERLELGVRQYPGQYLWMHDRWKAARRAGLLDECLNGRSRSQ